VFWRGRRNRKRKREKRKKKKEGTSEHVFILQSLGRSNSATIADQGVCLSIQPYLPAVFGVDTTTCPARALCFSFARSSSPTPLHNCHFATRYSMLLLGFSSVFSLAFRHAPVPPFRVLLPFFRLVPSHTDLLLRISVPFGQVHHAIDEQNRNVRSRSCTCHRILSEQPYNNSVGRTIESSQFSDIVRQSKGIPR